MWSKSPQKYKGHDISFLLITGLTWLKSFDHPISGSSNHPLSPCLADTETLLMTFLIILFVHLIWSAYLLLLDHLVWIMRWKKRATHTRFWLDWINDFTKNQDWNSGQHLLYKFFLCVSCQFYCRYCFSCYLLKFQQCLKFVFDLNSSR